MNITLHRRTAETAAVYFARSRAPEIRKTLPQKAQTLEEAMAEFRKSQAPGGARYGRRV